MLREEFLEITGFSEKFITSERYSYIDKAYMNTNESKEDFCDRFYAAYLDSVSKPTEMVISAKSVDEKERYLAGDKGAFKDVDTVHQILMEAFCKTFK